MKKFVTYSILFFSISTLVIIVFFNNPISIYFNNAKDVYRILNLSKNKINSKTILVGDSVCKQFFYNYNFEDVFCLCSNQAYEVVGNFLILKELLNNGSIFSEFILVINPLTLTSSLNQQYTYNYFYKPFKNVLNNFKFLEKDTNEYLKINFSNSFEPKYVFSNKVFFPNTKIFISQKENYNISKVNYLYINKIKELCYQNNIEFKIILPPLPDHFSDIILKFNNKDRLEFSDYFNSGVFYSDLYSKDGLHHVNPSRFTSTSKFQNFILNSFKYTESTISN